MRRLAVRSLLACGALAFTPMAFVPTAFAYRTAGETADFEGTSVVRWSRDQVSFVLNTEAEPSALSGGFTEVMLDALRQWNEPMCSSLELLPAGVTNNPARAQDGVNTIAWVRDWEERGFSADAPATTDVQYEREGEDGEWRIVEADLYLDARRSWTLWPATALAADADADDGEANQSLEQFDLLSVLTHEFGHAAGLMHPCEIGGAEGAPNCREQASFPATTMYPLYAADQATLETDDERGLCFLYKQDTCKELGCETGYECTDQGCEALCGDEVCAGSESCVDGECIAECTSLECLNPTCKRDRDCDATLRCDGKYCVPGLSPLGDPCATPRDCTSQACSKDGVCSVSCVESADCDEGEKCRAGVNGSRTCTTDLNALGDKCKESNQCLGEQCIADVVETPVCTRRCGEGTAECPLDWTCDLVEGRAVCVPPTAPAKGCGLRAPGAGQSTEGGAWLALLAGFVLTARRRTQTYKDNTV